MRSIITRLSSLSVCTLVIPLLPLMEFSSFVMPLPLDSMSSIRDLPFHFILDANRITDAQWCMQFSFFNPTIEEVAQFLNTLAVHRHNYSFPTILISFLLIDSESTYYSKHSSSNPLYKWHDGMPNSLIASFFISLS